MERTNEKARLTASGSDPGGSEPELNEIQRRDRNTHLLLLAWRRVLTAGRPGSPKRRTPASSEEELTHKST
jgi:hypothetical protein